MPTLTCNKTLRHFLALVTAAKDVGERKDKLRSTYFSNKDDTVLLTGEKSFSQYFYSEHEALLS